MTPPSSSAVQIQDVTFDGEVNRSADNPDKVRDYVSFHFLVSRLSGRVFLFDENRKPINASFSCLHVKNLQWSALPSVLALSPHNFTLVNKFVKHWLSLPETKRRLIARQSDVFSDIDLAYEAVRSKIDLGNARLLTKDHHLQTVQKCADKIGGSVRFISQSQSQGGAAAARPTAPLSNFDKLTGINENLPHAGKVAQVLNSQGVPLCISCSKKPCSLAGGGSATTQWQTRFCSTECARKHWMRKDGGFMRDEMFKIERGVCRLCTVDAHMLCSRISQEASLVRRAELIKGSVFTSLPKAVKLKMVQQPRASLFWEVDHIIPVYQGGGSCDIDNLRTLCTVCHRSVTSNQASSRSRRKKLQKALIQPTESLS